MHENKIDFLNKVRSQRDIKDNESNEEMHKRKMKYLRRPVSALNIGVPAFTSKGNTTIEDLYKKWDKTFFDENTKNEINLDLLFEKQLQKLREINNQCDINDKKDENMQLFINNINNKNNSIQNDNNINKSKKTFFRPSSHTSKHIKSLPRILSPKFNKNPFQQKAENSPNHYFSSKSPFHKDFGKIPKYIQEMKIKNKIEKDIQKQKEEEEKYPKGTRLLSEEERLFTLQKLKESKKELENLIEKLPITLNTLSSRNKQQIYFKKLDEIEHAITTFSKNHVFIKIDS